MFQAIKQQASHLLMWRPPTLVPIRWIWQIVLTLFMSFATFIGVYADVTSLGFTIGKTEYSQVIKKAPGLKDSGINKYSNGKMLKGMSPTFNIQGLQKTLFIFDEKDKLAVILMTLDKNQFDTVFGYLKAKYPIKSQTIPFVGDKHVVMHKDLTKIEITAPHMSFSMDVMYSTDAFDKAYQRIQRREAMQKNQREQSQF